ncbi:LBL_2463 family protein [Leptospira santarosai]|uniref:N-acetyltransferase domain-containing protein n=1 Tax=Leptospira santarosai TaxID=28183 RepID=A0AB73LYK5_9LEPT|nr:hypothetical protein [Leptospira santarosai]AVV50221.1 Uncharacterized protein XB17_01630 [Leptospira santarosai]MDI7166593.1 hypothetical protein [Leptospira santarosai]ONF93901.1 hypothetical protein BWD14_04455 [Leptospira santarosai]
MSLTLQKTKSVKKLHVIRMVGLENPKELQNIKKFSSTIFENVGYSKPLDSMDLDPWSTWFYVREGSEILAAMRIVEKRPNNLIPLELGIIKDSEPIQRYAVIGNNIADWNSVSFLLSKKGWLAAVQTFHAAAQYCIDKNFDTIYGFYHKKINSIVTLYTSIGAIPSKKYEKEVYFPECYYNGELVYLTPIEINKDALQKIRTRLW